MNIETLQTISLGGTCEGVDGKINQSRLTVGIRILKTLVIHQVLNVLIGAEIGFSEPPANKMKNASLQLFLMLSYQSHFWFLFVGWLVAG